MERDKGGKTDMSLSKEQWEQKKTRNAELEHRSRMCLAFKGEFLKPGNIISTQDGTKYLILPNGSRRRLRAAPKG
jgi:hypothetical protein